MTRTSSHKKTLIVGYPATWGNLIPSLQHTAYADAMLGNQFETLVRVGREGLPRPLGARSWEVSSDSRIFKFVIDNSRTYSDGTKLKASDFKHAWEKGLSEIPKSANNSLKDVLYNVEGFEDFEATKTLTGVIAASDDVLEIQFKKPFRMALDHLSGSRFAAFKTVDKTLLGTGRYRILASNENEVTLDRNPYFKEENIFDEVIVKKIEVKEGADAVRQGKIDVYSYFARVPDVPCKSEGNLECFTGAETGHITVNLNGMDGRHLEDPELRLALQALIHSILRAENIRPYTNNASVVIDPQTFLPLQAGHLEDDVVAAQVREGEKYIPKLISFSETNPLYFVSLRDDTELLNALKKRGVRFTENSGNVDFKTGLEMHYKTFMPDVLVGAFSVANGDPDGIYHLLGKQGAISSPMIFRKAVDEKLELGRSIIDRNAMIRHYADVGRQVLKDVPYVHVGFTVGQVVYNNKKIAVASNLKSREDVGFHIYSPIEE